MTKHQLVYDSLLSLHSSWMAPIVNQYFELTPYNPEEKYSAGTLFYTGNTSNQHLIEQGFRVIVDNLWELPRPTEPDCYTIQCNNWFWYNESLWLTYLGYDKYVPNKKYSKLALMPMRLQRPHRNTALVELSKYLDDFVWSYVSKGRTLPDDDDVTDWNSQRYFNPEWYDSTHFSLAIETYVGHNRNIFITEKTFKPIAYHHPFMIYGVTGTLARLRELGFETFDNLFDESYDLDTDPHTQLKTIRNNVENFVRCPYDLLTINKVKHNRDHFFNQTVVKQGIVEEIINPLLEYVNTKA